MLTMFVIKDLKQQAFGIPMFFRSPTDLRRHLATNLVRDPDALAALYPADYEVWAVGEWDETRGTMVAFPDMEQVCSMLEIQKLAQDAAAQRMAAPRKEVAANAR